MSIDFSTIKGFAVPEGNVKQNADASGNVLWSGDDGMRTVTLVGTIMNDFSKSWAYFEVDGEKYYRDVSISTGSTAPAQVYTFPIGTQIRFVAKAVSGLSDGNKATIKFNNQVVAEKSATKGGGEVAATYDYVLNGKVSVFLTITAIQAGTIQNAVSTISITES